MTEKVNVFNEAAATMQRAAGYRRGESQFAAYKIADAFRVRGLEFGTDSGK